MPNPIPDRVQRAVEVLDIDPAANVLEIGCGPGVAVSLVCEQLTNGRCTALDRSAVAIDRARRRNAANVAAGKAILHQCELKDFDSGGERFDVIFAINVNVFWAGAATAEITAVQSLLTANGVFFLFYERPRGGELDPLAAMISHRLTDAGFVVDVTGDELLEIQARDRRVGRCVR